MVRPVHHKSSNMLLTPEKGKSFPFHYADIIHGGIAAVEDTAAVLNPVNHHAVGSPGHPIGGQHIAGVEGDASIVLS